MKEIKIQFVLKRLMKERRITASQLSKATGVPNSTISTWLLPDANPKDTVQLAQVAEYFHVSLEYLLFDHGQKGPYDVFPLEPLMDGYYRLRLERVIFPRGSGGDL